jgi:hypothetical protein
MQTPVSRLLPDAPLGPSRNMILRKYNICVLAGLAVGGIAELMFIKSGWCMSFNI